MTFLNHCLKFYETDTHIFLHANYVPEIPLHQQPDEVIFWEHIKETVPGPHQRQACPLGNDRVGPARGEGHG